MESLCYLIKKHLEFDRLDIIYNYPIENKLKNINFLNEYEKNKILNEKNSFSQNIMLKKIISEKMLKDKFDFEIPFWITGVWGGIGALKDKKKIESFLKLLKYNEPINAELFSRISSLSKIASFMNPFKYAIYDSRAIYTLNWVISKELDEISTSSLKFFPMKDSVPRSKYIIERPISLILARHPRQLIHFEAKAFSNYCQLLREITPLIYPEYPNEIFRVEMLLFASYMKVYEDLGQKS